MVELRSTSSSQGPWPRECHGAISLTFDDGMRSQLETAIPLLDEHGLQATFYLNPPRDGDEAAWREKLAPWRATIPEQTVRSFGYPFYQSYVGAGTARQSYVPVIARHFVAARGKGETAND